MPVAGNTGSEERAERMTGKGVLETVHILNAVHAELSGWFEYFLDFIEFLNLPVAIFR